MSAKPKSSRTTAKPLRVNPRSPEPEAIGRAVEVLRAGGVVCFPTRCLYGLGADALDAAAVERVYEIKQRPADMPLLVLISRSDPPELAKMRVLPLIFA